jgi:lipoxygenase
VQETDPAVKAVFDSFVADIQKNVEPEIDRRNADPANVSRNPATGGMRYTLLYPSSDPGVTMQGVPYSISI